MSVTYIVNNKKILFVHIPKNLGRTINLVFRKYAVNSIHGHPDLSQIVDIGSIEELISADFILFVSRDPYQRAISLYNYFRNHSIGSTGHSLEHHYFLKNNFGDSLLYISNNIGNPQRLTGSKWGSTTSFLAVKNQKTFVDLKFISNPETRINLERKKLCLCAENIERDIGLFLDQLGVSKIEKDLMMKQVTEGGKIFKSIETKTSKHTTNEIELINKIYIEDLIWTKNEIR